MNVYTVRDDASGCKILKEYELWIPFLILGFSIDSMVL